MADVGQNLAFLPQWTAHDLRRQLERERDLVVLDVRQPHEWMAGHIDGARHITGAQIQERAGELSPERPVAVVCSSGYRSSVVASVLARRGYPRVFNVLGGMMAWTHAGFPTVKGK